MGVTSVARTYQATAAETPDPRHALVLLTEGLVRFLHQAREAMHQGDYQGQCDRIVHAQRIISALMSSLDREVAPEFTAGLWALYSWMHANLTEASIRDDEELLGQVIEAATGLHDAWRQARQELTAQENAAARCTAA
ncbi:MAG: flagellar export chaperone FliS [Armatimonadetes bacterium]|nr:flagellar export chaperone FliS [Armatimonadota bacterium]